jgi:predicted carbohydrate-binding protein with CBM5 and CBM33 domain
VALTGQGGKPLTRQDFEITVPLTADKPTASVVDDPIVLIPVPKEQNGDYYRIYVYFDVTEKELAYNRKNPQQR